MSQHVRFAMYLLSACWISSAISTTAAGSPKIGDKAPAVRVAKWITRKPPALPGEKKADNKVFLVEFWATWCPPCLKSIPHLSKLHEKHLKDGLVILGISNEETEVIETFIEKKMKMPYFVGQDDEMRTTEAWADDVKTIPHAFLVDKTGVVVWSGNPLGDAAVMDQVIQEVLADKFDAKAAQKTAAADRKYRELELDLQAAYTAQDKEKIFKTVDRMIALKPQTLKAYLSKRFFLMAFDRKDELPDLDALIEKNFKDSDNDLRSIVRFELGKELSDRSPGLMLHCALRLNELTKGRDVETLAMLARIQCEFGMIDAAIETQTEAVGLASDEILDVQKKVLAYYEAVKALGRSHIEESETRRKASNLVPSLRIDNP